MMGEPARKTPENLPACDETQTGEGSVHLCRHVDGHADAVEATDIHDGTGRFAIKANPTAQTA
jgi:hypothetical protein